MAIKYSSIGGGSGSGFNVQVGSTYSYATFTQAQPAGAYTIKSSNNYTNWDVYLLDASNNLVAYTGTASIAPTTAFSAIVVVNGTLNDILQFSFASTVFSTATTSQTKAGPFITAFGSSVIPSANSAVTITGGNFAVGITATFTGTDSVVRTCKSVVYTSTSSISVVRPDVLPIAYVPYTLTLTNPGINNPTTSGKHILTGLTVGNAPTWSTGTSLPAVSGGPYSTTVVATDAESSVTYSYVSGSLPAGLSFNSTTGVISGTYSGSVDGSTSYTLRATDAGGNFIDRTFTLAFTAITGGTLSSDATYYYRTFTGNGTLANVLGLTVDVLQIAGGGGGGYGWGGGGGAGGVIHYAGTTLATANCAVTIGAGGVTVNGDATNKWPGSNSTFTGLVNAFGGGGGAGQNVVAGGSGGSGGGSSTNGGTASSGTTGGTATQVSGTGYTGYGNAGGSTAGNASGKGGAGGGGAGAAGSFASGAGSGTNAFSSWLSAITPQMTGVTGWAAATSTGYIAGGGGAHSSSPVTTGGAGGGGAYGTNGPANAGGGGGSDFGNGASGIVIVRYTRASVGG
jgi:hypothetical protein